MLSQLLGFISASVYGLAVLAATALVVVVIPKLSLHSKLDAIPTAGSSTWLGSWWAGFKYPINALEVIQEGYEKHDKAPFKVAVFHRWMVVLSSREHVEELRRAPADELSFSDAMNDELQTEYTMGHGIHHNPYHIQILRSQLTRNIETSYSEIRNELIIAFDDILDLRGNEWKSVLAVHSVKSVICRTTNRLFVGLPLCRDPDWMNLNLEYGHCVVKGALIVNLFPTFLKPLAARLFTKVIESNERARKHLGPVIEERQKHLAEYKNQWADKPNDLLSWLMEEAEGLELTVEALAMRVLTCNFAAIHTTSACFTNALLYLAANPQYIQPLRKEVEGIVHEQGWSKASISKMRKVDSFLRETERMEGISGLSLRRKAMKDVTFSDGTFVPKGTIVAAASRSVHYDEAYYPNAHAFEPFRFVTPCQEVKEGEGTKHQFESTSPEYLAFGHGRHACPGRFFAGIELKSMLAHVVVTYDIKLEGDDRTQPRQLRFKTAVMPDPSVRVMFRKRVD